MKTKKGLISSGLFLSLLSYGTVFADETGISEINVPPKPFLTELVGNIVGSIKWIAIVVAVVMVIYVGIKYLTAGAGTKADVKSNLLPMLVGAILVASAGTIVDAVFTMVTN